jgi:hypothetical protein
MNVIIAFIATVYLLCVLQNVDHEAAKVKEILIPCLSAKKILWELLVIHL